MIRQVNDEAVKAVCYGRAGRTPCCVVGPEHEMVDEELRAASEEIRQRGSAFVRIESIVLVDPNPRQFLPPLCQFVTAPDELFFVLKKRQSRCQPLFACSGFVCCHRSSPLSL